MNHQLSPTMTSNGKQLIATRNRLGLRGLVFGFIVQLLLLFSSQRAGAFSMLGTIEPWMSPVNGFNQLPGEPLAAWPKNIGEEYRRTMPVLYYSMDQTFLDFFGSNGVYAVEQAFSHFNAVSNVSSYSLTLDEWPLESTRFNYQAQALELLDLKSLTMHLILENLGLDEPERYMWVIHNRAHLPNTPACPDGQDYLVVKRNFDPVPTGLDQYSTSSYVNGVLYTYRIDEFCTGPNPLADAVEFPVDQLADAFTAVASRGFFNGFDLGSFFISLTRDDIGGLRYLLRTNNMNIENAGPGTVQFVTNTTAQLLVGSNLTLFAAQALTNDPVTLATLYPGLVITSSSNFWGPIFTTNVTAFLTNGPPWAPPGSLTIAFATNRVFAGIQTFWIHHFANTFEIRLIDGDFVPVPMPVIPTNRVQRLVVQNTTVVVTNFPGPFSTNNFTLVTSTTGFTTHQRGGVGEFFIAPSNSCDVQIIGVIYTNVVRNTNIIVTSTNLTVGFTNATGATNIFNGQVISNTVQVIDFFTNHYFAVYTVDCPPNPVGMYQGVERLSFVRQDFDSLFGRFFQPLTNTYVLNEVTNSAIKPRVVRRIITRPDFLFTTADLDPGPAQIPYTVGVYARNIRFNAANNLPGLFGPGTIEPDTTFTFNRSTPIFDNFRLDPSRFLTEQTAIEVLAYGSFDGTTNVPVVYPNGTSIAEIEAQILMPILPPSLVQGNVHQPYSVQLSSPGGQAPLTFSIASGALPPGLAIDEDGLISGVPLASGTYEFIARLTDAVGKTVQRRYTLVIMP